MTILPPDILSPLEFKYIPRYDLTPTMEIVDEQQNTSQLCTVISDVEGEYYNTITFSLSTEVLKEDSVYLIKLYNGTEVIQTDKVFCTSQSIDTFSVNTGVYTNAPSTANQYILYDQ